MFIEIRQISKTIVPFCVYETPLESNGGKFKRPSHVDIVWANNSDVDEVNKSICEILLYNLIKDKDTLEIWVERKKGKFICNSQYKSFLPKKIRQKI